MNFGPAVAAVQEEINQISMRLEDVMKANIFANMSLETRPAGMTMTEYMDRRRRSAELMGPTVSSYEPRVLTLCIERVYQLLDEEGLLPPPPQGLSPWATLNVSYQSPTAQSQPTILDKLDLDQMVDELAQRLGVPASIIRSDEQVAAIRQQREQAAAAQQQADMEARMMESMAKVGNVRTQGTVAGEVMGRPQEDDA